MSWKSCLNPRTKIVIMFEIEEDIIKTVLFFACACKIKNYALFLQ